ncbi:MAG: iron ABC transporter permease [Bacteroidaceae bacterium]|nr:iron ABC transporter permease [Bacteroidaceae bacterium]
MKRWVSRKYIFLIVTSAIVTLLFVFMNIFVGAVDIPISAIMDILSGNQVENSSWSLIVLEARLPQAVTALLSGMALSVAGLMLQTLFNNPLAGPEVFGINSGAGLGVAVVMLLMHGTFVAGAMSLGGYAAMLAGAFAGALFIIAIILCLSSCVHNNIYLLIAGMSISYLNSAIITMLNYFSTAEGVHSYLIWGMGNFGGVSMEQMPFFASVIVSSLVVALLMSKPLNAIMLGDAYAANLGIHTKNVRGVILLLTGLLTAAVTAFCGPISFIGLAVPHFARLILRTNNHIYLLPITMFLGATVALLCNMLSQLPGESGLIPLGAITPLIGAPVILYVVLRNKGI